jgi:hypothetical protein
MKHFTLALRSCLTHQSTVDKVVGRFSPMLQICGAIRSRETRLPGLGDAGRGLRLCRSLTKLEFVINLRTAQALGLSIPQSVLQQATELIQ